MADQDFADFLDAELFGSDDPEPEGHTDNAATGAAETVEGP